MMTKLKILLSVLLFVGTAQAKIYFTNKTDRDIELSLRTANPKGVANPSYSDIQSIHISVLHPGDTLKSKVLLDWISDVRVIDVENTNKNNKRRQDHQAILKDINKSAKEKDAELAKFDSIPMLPDHTGHRSQNQREGGWPAPANRVTIVEEVDKSTGKKAAKILVNDK
jgi:hypothetical protein